MINVSIKLHCIVGFPRSGRQSAGADPPSAPGDAGPLPGVRQDPLPYPHLLYEDLHTDLESALQGERRSRREQELLVR